MTDTSKIRGKVVVITGGARGIGLATATALQALGAKVAIGDVDEATVKESGTARGFELYGKLDVTDATSFESFLDEVERTVGPIDVLINNAGIMPTGKLVDEPDQITRRILDINVYGVILGSKLGLARMLPRGSGHVINIASLAGETHIPGLATYNASKHAVVGFTSALHLELKEHGVQVSAVLPGIVRTELSAGANMPGWIEPMTTVDPEDVAQAIVRTVIKGKPLVTVPRRLAAIIKSAQLLPYRAQLFVARITGATTAYAQPDPEIREKYHRRLRGG